MDNHLQAALAFARAYEFYKSPYSMRGEAEQGLVIAAVTLSSLDRGRFQAATENALGAIDQIDRAILAAPKDAHRHLEAASQVAIAIAARLVAEEVEPRESAEKQAA